MKPSILMTAFLLLTLLTGAQSKQDSTTSRINLPNLPKSNIRLHFPAKAGSGFYLFNHFEVIDERSDTARIGVRTNKSGGFLASRDRQLVLNQSAATEIAGYLNQHFTRPDAPCTALVILRSLWLSDAITIPRDEISDKDKEFGKTHIRLKAEVCACKDSLYTHVFGYDTLYMEKTTDYDASLKFSFSVLDKNLSDLLINLADSASWVARDNQSNGRQINR